MTNAPVFPFPAAPNGAHVVADAGELDELFSKNAPAHLYSICDLDPPFWEHSRWYRRGDATVGLIGSEPGELLTGCSISTADVAGSNQLMAELARSLPPGLMLTGAPGMAAALVETRPVKWMTNEVRYQLRALPTQSATRVTLLDASHTSDLEKLYATEPGAAFFLPSMISGESFVGIWDEDEADLIAAAGTHLVSAQKRMAAIGAVYVRPDHRGHGLGTEVTLGVIERLVGRVDTIGLNASQTNTPARQIYERLGFVSVLQFEEAELADFDLSESDS